MTKDWLKVVVVSWLEWWFAAVGLRGSVGSMVLSTPRSWL